MEALVNAIRVFLEKHFLPTVIAVVIALVAFYLTPVDFVVLTKLGKGFYIVLIFCLGFLVVKAAISVGRWISRKSSLSRYQARVHQENLQENMEQLWTIIDGFSKADRDLIKQFLDNENTPITRGGVSFGGGLLSSDYVHSMTVDEPAYEDFNSVHAPSPKGTARIHFPTRVLVSDAKQYRLADLFYQMLKFSQENYGRISHFD